MTVRGIIEKWPQTEFEELLKLISVSVMTLHEKQTDEDMSFKPEVSKALMISACESSDYEDLWNCGINDEVPIHFDNFKAFLCACKNGNLQMITDFRRFQYDEEDGRNMIPDDVWEEGASIAKQSSHKAIYTWIEKYLKDGTDEEEEDEEEDGGENMDDDEEDEDEYMIYEEIRRRLKEQKMNSRDGKSM